MYWEPRDCAVKMKPSTARDQEVLDVQHHLENDSECRRNILLAHFDLRFATPENEGQRCCDVCARKEK